MQTQVITTRDELRSLQGEWNELLAASDAHTIFLTWEWIAAWLDAVRPAARLLTIVVRDETGRLLGVAPFYTTQMRLARVVAYRVLRVLGDQDSGAEYPDIIIRTHCEGTVLPAMARALRAERRHWHCLWLRLVADWGGAYARFARLGGAAARWLRNARPVDFGAVGLPSRYEDYWQGLSGNARSAIRRSVKRVTAAAPAVEFVRCQKGEQLAELLAALFELHQRRWMAAGLPGCFPAGAPLRRFYERFAPVALRRGWLRLYGLKLDGVLRAVQYGYAYAGTFYQLQEGYDPAAPDGVGNALRERVFQDCIAERLHTYDFLGEFTEHKRRWGAVQRWGYDVLLGRPALRNRMLFTRPVWPTGRFLREAAPLSSDSVQSLDRSERQPAAAME